MQASDLKDRIAFASRPEEEDDFGGSEGDFEDQFSRWANIKPRLGGETVIASRLEGRSLVNITVRYDPQTVMITPAWRARKVDGGTVYNVKSAIDPFEHTNDRRQWIELLCETGGGVA